MYEEAVGLGLGYLVYKGIMTELAKEPVKEGVKAGQLIGWDTPAQFEEGLTLWAGGTGKLTGDIELMKRGEYAAMYDTLARKERITGGQWEWGIPTPLSDITFGLGGSLLPEGFELVGPSRTGITLSLIHI